MAFPFEGQNREETGGKWLAPHHRAGQQKH